MKFRQRQLLLSVVLACSVILLLLHSWIPQSPDVAIRAAPAGSILAAAQVSPVNPNNIKNSLGKSNFLLRDVQVRDGVTLDERKKDSLLQTSKYDVRSSNTSGLNDSTSAEEEDFSLRISFVKRTPSRASEGAGECHRILRPVNELAENRTFQNVDGQSDLFVFSAFLDGQEKLVRVVAISKQRDNRVFCLLWYATSGLDGADGSQGGSVGEELKVVSVWVTRLPEHHGKKYSAAYIQCPLPDDRFPYAVTVTSSDCRNQPPGDAIQPSNVLLVQQAPGLEHNFTVCVTPINYKYSRAYELVEMVELNRMLGADYFTFYINSMGKNVARVLRWYEQQGLVKLVPWKLPVTTDHWPPNKAQPPLIHYFGQLASHNDCLNRHRGRSRYLVYEDLDEFIIPKKTQTWTDLMHGLRKSNAYIFRCVFFRKDWSQNEEQFPGRVIADKFKSIVLMTDKREPRVFSHGQRSKYIINPLGINVVGIHNIWKYRGPLNFTSVLDRDALLHHYRSWENPQDRGTAVRDTDIYRFKDELLKRLEERWAELPDVPLDIPLSTYGQV